MNPELVRLLLPAVVGVLLGLFFAFRGFFRARAGAPEAPGFVRLLAGLAGAAPVTKLLYAAILAFASTPPATGRGVPVFQPENVFFVAGGVLGLMALAQGLVAFARMPKMLGDKGVAILVTLIVQAVFEALATFAMVGGLIALQMTN